MINRVFYAASGAGNLIESHEYWKVGLNNPTEVSLTFSGQIQEFCKDIGASAYMISMHSDERKIVDGNFTFEHRPKPGLTGWRYHAREIRYCWNLLKTARQFDADIALLDSGAVSFYLMTLFRIFGISVIPILHNTLWPSGFRPVKLSQKLLNRLDAIFFRFVPKAIVAVSPEAERQVKEIAPRHKCPIFQIRAQFLPEYFARILPPPLDRTPFQIMFIGRVDESKGVLDIPVMAQAIEALSPGLVRWVICGRGPALEELKRQVALCNLTGVIDVRGWTSLDDLVDIYSQSHASIVPTRSTFAEGLAMTAAEAILAGRPIVSNPIVPALEILESAAVCAKSNDADSHAMAVYRMATDSELYNRLQAACAHLQKDFYNRELGLTAVLKRAII